jgi:hypothetical protein
MLVLERRLNEDLIGKVYFPKEIAVVVSGEVWSEGFGFM